MMLPSAKQYKNPKRETSERQQQLPRHETVTADAVYQRTHFLAQRLTFKHALVHLRLLIATVWDQLVSLRLELALLLETRKQQ